MIEITFGDRHMGENIKAIAKLRKLGFTDEEIQKLYDKQVETDKSNEVSRDVLLRRYNMVR